MSVQALDYPERILIDVNSPVEREYRAKSCSKEPWTIAFIEAAPPNSWFVDVGANVGAYTLVAVKRNLRVIAIEPGYENYRSLCHNLSLNAWLDRAQCLLAAQA